MSIKSNGILESKAKKVGNNIQKEFANEKNFNYNISIIRKEGKYDTRRISK